MHPTFVVMGGGQKQMKTKQKVNGDKTNKRFSLNGNGIHLPLLDFLDLVK
jgi:hypothetical protein